MLQSNTKFIWVCIDPSCIKPLKWKKLKFVVVVFFVLSDDYESCAETSFFSLWIKNKA